MGNKVGKLYVVGTPLGNLADWSPRAAEVLAAADFIAAEDTRVTLKLLNKFNIKTPMVSYHEHNHKLRGEQILGRLLLGESCALVTDAGMPAISDPGEDLVRLARQHGVEVCSVPGPSALITALAASGLPSGRFCFEGFLSVNKNSRREHLLSVQNDERTLIFYEAPHHLKETLKQLCEALGRERPAVAARELTKHYEEFNRRTLGELWEYYQENEPRGEFVLVVSGFDAEKADAGAQEAEPADPVQLVAELEQQGISRKEAMRETAKRLGISRRDVYNMLLKSV